MPGRQPYRWRARSNAALLTLAAHAPFALLLWLDDGMTSRRVRHEPPVRTLAITLLPLVAPVRPGRTEPVEPPQPGAPKTVPSMVAPAAAITLPAAEGSPSTELATPREVDRK